MGTTQANASRSGWASGNTEIYLLDGFTTLGEFTVNGSGGNGSVLLGLAVVGNFPGGQAVKGGADREAGR